MARSRADRWKAAVAHLTAADVRLTPIVERIGPCGLVPRRDRFGTLVRAIIGQQISSKAAAAIDRRLKDRAGDPHAPAGLIGLGLDGLRSAGLSAVKAQYVLNLSQAVGTGSIPLDRISRWDDERIVASLTAIKGIGRWTAEMFLIFALNRPDVLPVADLGVRVAFRKHFGLSDLPKPSLCHELAAPWRPWRTVAIWYLWRDLDTRPLARPA
jgi:DNA-3-methyladenine glycosylase II